MSTKNILLIDDDLELPEFSVWKWGQMIFSPNPLSTENCHLGSKYQCTEWLYSPEETIKTHRGAVYLYLVSLWRV